MAPVRLAALLALLLAASCGDAAAGGGPAAVEISVAAPVASGVAPGRAAAPGAPPAPGLTVRITEIDNPGMEPFGVIVTLDATGDELGRFYVHPPDRTGEHALPLDAAGAEALASGGLTFRLDPLAPDPAPFSVTLEAELRR